jgi:hypothetical protein
VAEALVVSAADVVDDDVVFSDDDVSCSGADVVFSEAEDKPGGDSVVEAPVPLLSIDMLTVAVTTCIGGVTPPPPPGSRQYNLMKHMFIVVFIGSKPQLCKLLELLLYHR